MVGILQRNSFTSLRKNPTPLIQFHRARAHPVHPSALTYTCWAGWPETRNRLDRFWGPWAMSCSLRASRRPTRPRAVPMRPLAAMPLDHAAGKHGRQGGPFRDSRIQPCRHRHHRHVLWCRQFDARQLQSTGRHRPLINIKLGEVVFGGVGAGLFGILMFRLLSCYRPELNGRSNARIFGEED